MLYYTAVLNGVIAPPLLVIILVIANNRKIMGERVNSVRANVFAGIITVAMGVSSIALIVSLF